MTELLNTLQKTIDDTRIYIIGIDGLGGSGKTTFTEILGKKLQQQSYNVEIFHIDDFIHKKQMRYRSNEKELNCYYYLQWRYDYLISEILLPLKKSNCIDKEVEIYDKDNDKYISKHIKALKNSVILLEGVFLQRTELEKYFDFVIYLDTPKDIRFQRVLDRDKYIGTLSQIKTKYENRYFPAEDKYESENAPKVKADFVLRHPEII